MGRVRIPQSCFQVRILEDSLIHCLNYSPVIYWSKNLESMPSYCFVFPEVCVIRTSWEMMLAFFFKSSIISIEMSEIK